MAGATNRAMKSAGVPKASIKTIRVKAGGRLTLQSAISIAREHGLDVGKAPGHLARREAKVETKRQAAQATAKAAQQGKVARSLGDAGKGMRAARKAEGERKAALQAASARRQTQVTGSVSAASKAMLAARKAGAKPTFDGAMNNFKAHAQKVINDYYKANGFKATPPTLHYSDGEKYIRVTSVDAGSKTGSAHAFIDKSTGDVLKPDGYKRPAKGARGNIYTGNFGVGPHGANYSEAYTKRRFDPSPAKHGGFTRAEAVAAAKKASFTWKNAESGGYVTSDGRAKIVRDDGGWTLHGPNGYKRRVAKGASLEHATAMLGKAGIT